MIPLHIIVLLVLKSAYAYLGRRGNTSDDLTSYMTGEEPPQPCPETMDEANQEATNEANSEHKAEPVSETVEAESVPESEPATCPTIDNKFVEAVVERLRSEIPGFIQKLDKTPSGKVVNETLDTVYRSQIAAAQEFLNENRSADLSRVKCLLQKLLPKDYFEYIEQLREHQDPQTIINIMGGQNIVATSACSATQSYGRGKSPKKGS